MTIPSVAEIRDQIMSDYEEKLGQDIPILPRAFIYVWATVVAGVLHLAYRFGMWIYRQIFATTADAEALVRIGGQYGLTRIAAQPAILTIEISGNGETAIPIGTLWQYNGIVFEQTDAAETDEFGSTTTDIQALTAGTAGNVPIGDSVTLVKPVAGIDNSAAVTVTVQTGEDTEDLETFRDRIILRQQLPPQGGSIPDWIAWTLEVPGVIRALVTSPTAGTVTVYALVGTTEEDRKADETKRDEIEEYLSDDSRRPINIEADDITVSDWTETVFDVQVTNVFPIDVALRATIEAAIEAYLLSRFPRQYTIETNPQDRITEMDILAICRDSGAEQASVAIQADTVPLIDGAYQLDAATGELALPGTISVESVA
jgi:uncharacterized phage protein gp47/JayE